MKEKILNEIILKDNKSEHFDLITYPDGQHSIKLKLYKLNIKLPVLITCRIKNFSELEVLLCLYSALKKNDFAFEYIDFIYLFGMRSDRAFSSGEPNYFRDVVAPIINSLKYGEIYINKYLLFPHSVNSSSLLIDSAPSYKNNVVSHNDFGKSIKIGGDKSVSNSFVSFNKKRIENRIEVYLSEKDIFKLKKEIKEYPDHQLLIVDDLCDAGGTFIAEAQCLRKILPTIRRLSLFVCHGLFTKGVTHVSEHFDHIYTTNSYQDFALYDTNKLTVIEVI